MAATILTREQPRDPAARPAGRAAILADLERVDTYPTLSDTTARAMALVNNPDASVAEVAGLVRRDGVIAAAVLRRANNWTYGGRKVVDNVQQAILRVGLQECGKMLCTMGVRAMYNRCPPAVQKRCDAVHRHSLFVAHLATGLNRVACLGFGGVEFTAGLLHDIGRVIIGVKSPPDAAPPPAGADADCLNAEREQYGIDHCAVGYQFATRNNLPEPLVRAILNHHRPDDEQLQRKLVSLLAVANRVAHHVQREHNIAGYDLDKCPFLPVLAYDWSGEKEDAFRRAVPATVVRALKDTRHMLKAFG